MDRSEQRWKTARHEAGHAVAALHYGCPLAHTSIEADGHKVGTTRLAEPEVLPDGVVLFCGPLAELDWAEFRPGNNIRTEVVGSDLAGLRALEAIYGDVSNCHTEALLFLSQPAVQQQVDRIAEALVERTTLTADQVRAISGFAEPLKSAGW